MAGYYYPGYYQQPTYQQPTYQQPINQTALNQIQQDERIWVQGEGAAQAYLVAPNSFVRLWDSNAPVFYEKRADSSGRPSLEVFEYSRKGAQMPSQTVLSNVDRDYSEQIEALKKRIEAIEEGMKNEQNE